MVGGRNVEAWTWEVPEYRTYEFRTRESKYCVCIPVINEGSKLKKQLERMADILSRYDVIIADGGSFDGSTDPEYLRSVGVRSLLVKVGPGKLSAQLRIAFAYAMEEGYAGVITVDGNNKDSVESVDDFAKALDRGYDFVQGSRYVPGGRGINTPKMRDLAIRLIHAPIISLISGYRYTDTTNGFRGMSRKLLMDPAVNVFRDVFQTYELLAYLSVRAARLNYEVTEIPVVRRYPKKGRTPTKISPIKGNLLLLRILWNLLRGCYNP